jgi:long-subunit acyl-CoA synthetase (AMP-forming)
MSAHTLLVPLVLAVGSVWHLLYELLDDDDTYLAFLPLAHILEFVVEMAWIYAGLPIGYGRVKTLTDASVRECHGDLIEFKPSIIVGVPAVSGHPRSDLWELRAHAQLVRHHLRSGSSSARASAPKSKLPAPSRRRSSTAPSR